MSVQNFSLYKMSHAALIRKTKQECVFYYVYDDIKEEILLKHNKFKFKKLGACDRTHIYALNKNGLLINGNTVNQYEISQESSTEIILQGDIFFLTNTSLSPSSEFSGRIRKQAQIHVNAYVLNNIMLLEMHPHHRREGIKINIKMGESEHERVILRNREFLILEGDEDNVFIDEISLFAQDFARHVFLAVFWFFLLLIINVFIITNKLKGRHESLIFAIFATTFLLFAICTLLLETSVFRNLPALWLALTGILFALYSVFQILLFSRGLHYLS